MSRYIRLEDAIETAYQLRHEPADEEWNRWLRSFNSLPAIEVSEDAISRDYVRLIESDEDAYHGDWNETYERGFTDAINKVLNAPSVIPSRRKGASDVP